MSPEELPPPPPHAAIPPPFVPGPATPQRYWPTPDRWPTLPPPTLPPPTEPSRAGRRVVVVLLVVLGALGVLLAGTAAAVLWWLGSATPDHPETWDPRVQELVEFIEQDTGRSFDHPVHVNFLDPDAYREEIGAGEPLDADAGAAAEREAGIYRALGLASGELDLIGASETLWAEGTSAFYDSEREQVYVNGVVAEGAPLPVDVQVVVLHELVHAAQDQAVDLDVLEVGSTAEGEAQLAVIEGDASAMEQRFAAELSDDEFEQLLERSDAEMAGVEDRMDDADVPEVLSLAFGLPYMFGPSWVTVELERRGPEGVLDALGAAAPSGADVLTLGEERSEPVEVSEPDVPDDAEQVEVDSWGAFTWLLAVAASVDGGDAIAAVEAIGGWVGDSVATYEGPTGVACFEANLEFVDAPAAARFRSAMQRWADDAPASAGRAVDGSGDAVSIGGCDPGSDAPTPSDADPGAVIEALALRNEIIASVIAEGGVEMSAARCYAEGLLTDVGVEALTAEDDEYFFSDEFTDIVVQLSDACGI